ncbi:MAG: hypothetical protein H0W13_09210 [Nitrospirales bacterium]|nr:hypothetical protein [Nitrospirales bacterium]
MIRVLNIGVVLSALLLAGCGLFAPIFGPVSQTTTSNIDQAKDEGYLRFTNIKTDQEILLDGDVIGLGGAYAGGGLLGIALGSHDIEIRESGLTRFKQKVFINTGATRTIEIK